MTINAFNSAKALNDADNAAQNGDFSKAEILLSEIAQRNSGGFPVLLRLAIVRRQRGDYTGALDALSSALLVRPGDLSALLMQANILRAFGRREEAAKTYAKALNVAGSADDLPIPLRAELKRAVATVSEYEEWRHRIAAVELGAANPESRARLEKLRGDILAGADGPLLLNGLPIRGFYNSGDFPGVSEFEAATPTILAEFQALIAQRAPELVSATQGGHGATGVLASNQSSRKWSAIHLISDGKRIEENAVFAPFSIALFERLNPPSIAGRFPNLMFSILDPHTRIPPHHGIINTRLVIHIPLIVPKNCALRVGPETREWEPGTALIFDDTIEHEAWNDSSALRVVLLGDLWRPELDTYERSAVAMLMARG